MKHTITPIITALLLSACAHKTSTPTIDSEVNLNDLYDNSTIALFSARPSNSTMYGLDQSLTGGKFNHRLADFSPDSEARMRQSLRNINQQLKNVENPDNNTAVMQNITRYFAGSPNFDIGYIDVWMGLSPFIVNQINGPLIDVPNAMITNQQINNVSDAVDYVTRLESFDVFVNNIQNKMSADANKNWLPPRVIITKTRAAMESFLKPAAHAHPFVTSFITKLETVDGISEEGKRQLTKRVKQAVSNTVYPAYTKVIAQLRNVSKSATENSGIWAQPNGTEYYKDAVRMLGDTDLSPAQIHQLGLDEVTRISAEMDTILRAQGYTQGTVGQRMLQINDDPKFLYEDSDAGRQQLLNDINGYINEISDMMDEQFATRPKYAVEVRKFPKAREASAPGGMYTNPPLDGSQPGIYWINLRDIKANPKFDLKTLTYHEAIPGHHWQVALNLEQDSLPMLRRIAPYNAYVEGWALYSEKVAKEMGLYKNDPFSDLGRLKAEMFRAVRLVVDTGLHYKKWSREQAIKYMAETTGTVESDVVAEIERYMVWPGQALGYKLGMINILRLREEAKKQLGGQFDIKAFHDLVLLNGAMPMNVLNDNVALWIKQQKNP